MHLHKGVSNLLAMCCPGQLLSKEENTDSTEQTSPSAGEPSRKQPCFKHVVFMRFAQHQDLQAYQHGPLQDILNETDMDSLLSVSFAVQPAQKTHTTP